MSAARTAVVGGIALLAACTIRTTGRPTPPYYPPPPQPQAPPREEPPRERPGPSTAVTLGVPPGHLPRAGECRVWIPGTPPGRQPRPRSRPCERIASAAPAGSWIVYRPTYDRRLVYVRVVDERRPGIVLRVWIFDVETKQLLREEAPEEEPRQYVRPREEQPRDQQPPPGYRPPPPQQRPPENKPPAPPAQRPPMPPPEIVRPVPPQPEQRPPENKPPEQPPPEQRPPEQRPPEQRPLEQPSVPSGAVTLDVPPGHLPEPGECRVWIPGTPPGRQPRPKSRPCEGIAALAPAGSWILYRPSQDRHVLHVRVVDERRAGVVIRVRIYDIDTNRLLREENP